MPDPEPIPDDGPKDDPRPAPPEMPSGGAPLPKLDLPYKLGKKFILLDEIARCGQGVVYLAHQRIGSAHRDVAVKVLRPDRTGRAAIERFLRECSAVGELRQHDNVVWAVDADIEDDLPYLAMEFLDGLSLQKLIDRHGPLPVAVACELVRQAALGLGHLHDHRLIHRDVKPGNLMLTTAGKVKLIDLGLVRRMEPPAEGDLSEHVILLGSFDYAAPEQLMNPRDVDIRADLYGLGATLYALLAGRAPFDVSRSGDPERDIKERLARKPEGLERKALPPELDDLLNRLLASNPASRPSKAAQVASQLSPFANEHEMRAVLRVGSTVITGTSRPTPFPRDTLATSARAWFKTLGYGFEDSGEWKDYCFQMVIKVPKGPASPGFDRILVRCFEGEAQPSHVSDLREAVKEEDTDVGWLIVPLRVSAAVAGELKKDKPCHLYCYTFDELIDKHADFSKYLNWLESEIKERGIKDQYVPLTCVKEEYFPGTKKTSQARYDESNGGLDGYIDRWLDDLSKGHISILGDFGTGKTWFGLNLAWRKGQEYLSAKKQGLKRPRLPLYIPLRDYAKAATVQSLLSEFFFRKHEIGLRSYSAFEQLNRMGKLLLIFDGFDEMAARIDRQKMIDNFWQLASVVVPGSKAILTCRREHFPEAIEEDDLFRGKLPGTTEAQTGEPPQFETVGLELFNASQIRTALTKRGIPLQKIERILGNEDLKDLARRPLLIDYILEALPNLPEDARVDLARVFLIAVRRKMEREIKQERTFTSQADKLYFLCEISWEMLNRDQMQLHYTEFPDRIRNLFGERVRRQKDLDHWGFDMIGRTMLIRSEDGEYSLAHRSLVEFFAAFKFIAELGVLAPEFLELVQPGENPDNRDSQPREKWSAYFKRELDEGGNPKPIAPRAGFAPEEEGDEDEQAAFVETSKLPPNALTFAARMVSREPEAIDRLCQMAWQQKDKVARKARFLLPFLAEDCAADIAEKLIAKSQEGSLRSGVAWVLGELGIKSEGVCGALRRTLEAVKGGTGDRLAWWESAFALRKLGQLGGELEGDDEGPVQCLAAHLPVDLCPDDPQALERARARLFLTLEATDPREAWTDPCDVAAIAAHKGKIDPTTFWKEVCSRIIVSTDELGRRAYHVLWLCGRLRIKESVKTLTNALEHPFGAVRSVSAEALGKIGDTSPEVIAGLKKCLEDRYYRTRFHAAWALGKLGAVESIKELSAAIRREEVRKVRMAMIEVMQGLEEKRQTTPTDPKPGS